MSDINKYFDLGIYNEDENNTHLDNLIKLNNIEIDINYSNFNKLSNIQKKKLFPFLNKKNVNYEQISIEFIIDVNSAKDTYFLSYDDMKYYQGKVEEILEDSKLIKKYMIDPYNFTRYGNFKILNNIDNVISIYQKPIYNNDYIKTHDTIKRLGIYLLPKDASPGFKNFRRIIQYLKEKFNIYLFLDNKIEDIDDDDKQFIDGVSEIYYVSEMSDRELGDLIYDKRLTILLAIYGFYKRKSMILMKPASIIVSFQEPPIIYPTTCYDYNLIDINLLNILKKYAKIDTHKFNFITLKNFILPIPYYSKFNSITSPIYNPDCIRIGIVMYAPKICYNIIKLIENVIAINPNILVTIYGWVNKEWIKSLLPSKQVQIDQYDNTNPVKLLENILFLDPIFINGHSTALEIIKLKRPLIGYLNRYKYLGCFSQSIIKTINMDGYLIEDNIKDYTKLVRLYTYNEDVYYKFYNKFIKKLDESKILSDEHYANNLAKTLNEFYAAYYKNH